MVKTNARLNPAFIADIKTARDNNKCWFDGKKKYRCKALKVTRTRTVLIPLCYECWDEYNYLPYTKNVEVVPRLPPFRGTTK